MSDLFVEGIDDELWDMMDVDRRTKKEIVETALWEHYGGRKKTSLEAKLEHKKNERKAVKQSIEAEEEQLERVDREIRAIETKIEKFDKTEDAYYSALDDLLDRLESDDLRRLVPAACADVGENFGKDPEEVHDDAKERAANQERELLTTRFMPPGEADDIPMHERETVVEAWGDDDAE